MRNFVSEKMIGIKDAREILKKKFMSDFRYWMRDISGGNAYGYDYEIVFQQRIEKNFCDENENVVVSYLVWDDIRTVARSKDTYFPNCKNKIGGIGAYGPSFDLADMTEVTA
jgi:hypothetical protein